MTGIRSKRILFVIPHLPRGGAERVVTLLCKELSRQHQVEIVIYHGPVEYETEVKVTNLGLRNTGMLSSLVNLVRRTIGLRREFARFQPDLIISFIGNLQPILSGWPVVVSVRIDPGTVDEFIPSKFLQSFLYRTMYRLPNVQRVVTVSQAIEKKFREKFGLKRVTTIYNPLDFEDIERLSQAECPFEFPYIVTVGNLKTQKAHDILIRAYSLSRLPSRGVKLVIVGGGEQRKALEKLTQDLGLVGLVVFTGRQKNPFLLVKHAQMFVLSSRFEGLPNALLEALACSLACISTDCETGPREIITHGDNGLLVPVDDPAALAAAIDRLGDDPELAERLRQRARASVEKHSLENIAKLWLELPV